METATRRSTYTIEMAMAAAEKLPPALASPHNRIRLAVLDPDSLIPVKADPAAMARTVHYEYIVFKIEWFVTGQGTMSPQWIVEAHPEWGWMGH